MTTGQSSENALAVSGRPLQPRRRDLGRDECLTRLRQHTSGRVAITTGALPFITVVRYYVIDETIFFDARSLETAQTISQQIVAFESGTTDADPRGEAWSVCAVGVALLISDPPRDEPVLRLHPELLTGWAETPSC
jgi:hypothetical protein